MGLEQIIRQRLHVAAEYEMIILLAWLDAALEYHLLLANQIKPFSEKDFEIWIGDMLKLTKEMSIVGDERCRMIG